MTEKNYIKELGLHICNKLKVDLDIQGMSLICKHLKDNPAKKYEKLGFQITSDRISDTKTKVESFKQLK